jgi:hypothetical protein
LREVVGVDTTVPLVVALVVSFTIQVFQLLAPYQ